MIRLLEQAFQKVQMLPPDEQDRIAQEVLALVERDQHALKTGRKPRTPGLAKGMIEMADDFNDPLPDSFWLGEEGGCSSIPIP